MSFDRLGVSVYHKIWQSFNGSIFIGMFESGKVIEQAAKGPYVDRIRIQLMLNDLGSEVERRSYSL